MISRLPAYSHLTTIGLMIICCLTHLQGKDEPDTKGTYFIVGFLDNNSTENPELLVIPQGHKVVNISVRMPNNAHFPPIFRSLKPSEIAILELEYTVRMSGDKLGNQGVEIAASSDVVVYAVNKGNGSSDAFLALPRDALGDEYYVASYKPSKTYVSQVGIVGVENDTRVNISTPRQHTDLYVNGTLQQSGSTFSVNISAFETLQLLSDDDLTGAWIKGTSPLVVISGDTAVINQTQPFLWNDHFEEQLSPTKSWGRSFATVPFSDGLKGDIFRIIASKNKTTVRVKKRKTDKTIYLDSGEFAEVIVSKTDFISVVSSKPVLLLQYILAEDIKDVSCDSYMLLVPPLEQRQHQYLFSTVRGEGAKNINLVITSNMVDGLLLDGKQLTDNISQWIHIEGQDGNYSAVKLTVSDGRHNLSHDTESGVFAAMSYGFPLGMRMVELSGEVYDVTYTAEEHQPETYTKAQNSVPVVPPLSQADIMTSQMNRVDAAVRETYEERTDDGWSPAVLAVIISLSASVFFVIACILGFLAAELVCKGDGPFRSIKILPMAN